MDRSVVAVVGRPNVGKSTLFNYLIGERRSIVDKTPGVTRDRMYGEVEWLNRRFTLIDTGGLEPESQDALLSQMRRQTELAIETADLILFLVDGRDGIHPADEAIAMMLRRSGKPVVLAVNKLDNVGDVPPEFYNFYSLGFEHVYPISSSHALGLGDLLDGIFEYLPEEDEAIPEPEVPRLALIGRPNSGKSSLLNFLAGEERAIVTDMAGTTRDAVEERILYDGQPYFIVDTAGMRRRSKVSEDLEYYSIVRAQRAIERCDVAILLIDAAEGPSEQDTKIAGLVLRRGKPLILCVNKWDLPKEQRAFPDKNSFEDDVWRKFAFMPWAFVRFISAKTGLGMNGLMEAVNHAYQSSQREIRTSLLNEFIWEAQALQPVPMIKGKQLRLRYSTQIGTAPPTFLLFVNDKKLMRQDYLRYLENALRRNFDFAGTPIRFVLRQQRPRTDEDEGPSARARSPEKDAERYGVPEAVEGSYDADFDNADFADADFAESYDAYDESFDEDFNEGFADEDFDGDFDADDVDFAEANEFGNLPDESESSSPVSLTLEDDPSPDTWDDVEPEVPPGSTPG